MTNIETNKNKIDKVKIKKCDFIQPKNLLNLFSLTLTDYILHPAYANLVLPRIKSLVSKIALSVLPLVFLNCTFKVLDLTMLEIRV